MQDLRNNLRPVEVSVYNGRLVLLEREKGYFHCFSTIGNQVDGFETVAIIETLNGNVNEYPIKDIRFTDIKNNNN